MAALQVQGRHTYPLLLIINKVVVLVVVHHCEVRQTVLQAWHMKVALLGREWMLPEEDTDRAVGGTLDA